MASKGDGLLVLLQWENGEDEFQIEFTLLLDGKQSSTVNLYKMASGMFNHEGRKITTSKLMHDRLTPIVLLASFYCLWTVYNGA